jgi:archaeal type IV pilus assembly protein PilA
MNMFGKRERGWRKARKRGVSPIIATILLVAITVVLAAVLYVLISGLTSGGASSVPIGTTFAFGTPTQSANGLCASATAGYCYSVGVQSAGSSATTGNIHFGLLKSGTGSPFTSVQVLSVSGSLLATYTATNGWQVGAGTGCPTAGCGSGTLPMAFASTQTLLVSYATTSIEGQSLEAIGVGSISGSVSVVLP